jgi:hypothetical protein
MNFMIQPINNYRVVHRFFWFNHQVCHLRRRRAARAFGSWAGAFASKTFPQKARSSSGKAVKPRLNKDGDFRVDL